MTQQEATQAINEVVESLKPIVQKIETGPEMTQNHYGKYMQILGMERASHVEGRLKLAACLIKAGANVEGITAALKVLHP